MYETFPMVGPHDQFERGQQEDAHELLTVLLDRVHSETRQSGTTVADLRREKTVGVQKFWDGYLARHGSLTSRVFEGLQRVSICCTGCQKVDQKCESFSYAPLTQRHQPRTRRPRKQGRGYLPEELPA